MTSMAITGAAGVRGIASDGGGSAGGGSVVAIDAMTDHYDPRSKERNASPFRSHPRCDFLEADLVVVDLWDILARVDAVAHLAAQAGGAGELG